MKITWNNAVAAVLPEIKGNKKVVLKTKVEKDTDTKTQYMKACKDLLDQFNSYDPSRSFIRTLTINTKDIQFFRDEMSYFDKTYRDMFGGNHGLVALNESENIFLEAELQITPASKENVFRGYTGSEISNQYNTFLTAPDFLDIVSVWKKQGPIDQQKRDFRITYGQTDEHHSLDIFLPKNTDKKVPLLVFIHGGYWEWTENDLVSMLGPNLTKEGIAVATINYPHVPEASIVDIVEDCQKAVRYLYLNADKYGFDKDKFTVGGHSAGGHLAGMMGVTKWDDVDQKLPAKIFQHTFAFSGAFDMEASIHVAKNHYINLTKEDLPKVSVKHMQLGDYISDFSIFVGGLESEQFHYQSEVLFEAVSLQNKKVTMYNEQGLHHFSLLNELVMKPGSKIYNLVRDIAYCEE